MKRFVFTESTLKECHFTNSLLSEANFVRCNLVGTIFHNCDLTQADFSYAVSYAIDPRTNKLKGAKFTLPEAINLLQGFEIILE